MLLLDATGRAHHGYPDQHRDPRPVGVDLEPAFAWLREADAAFSTYREDTDDQPARPRRGDARRRAPRGRRGPHRVPALNRDTDGYFSVRPEGRLDPSGYVKGWAVAGAAAGSPPPARALLHQRRGRRHRSRRPAQSRWRIGIRHPRRPDNWPRSRGRGPRRGHLRRVRTRRPHPRPPHGTPPAGLQSVTIIGPDLAARTPTRPPPSPWASSGPAWTATLDRYEALCITTPTGCSRPTASPATAPAESRRHRGPIVAVPRQDRTQPFPSRLLRGSQSRRAACRAWTA